MIYTLRTRIKHKIVAEFVRPSRRSNRVIILCTGMPSYPAKKELMFFLAAQGYWVFLPRYRGSWESEGWFLARSPHWDIIDVIDSLSSGFFDLWHNKKYRIKNPKIYLIGSSFGGPAVILASQDKRVKKAVALSPVIDWRRETKLEPIDWLGKFIRLAFGNGYRFKPKDWNKLKRGAFYNPMASVHKLDKDKLYIIHAQDDKVVYADTSVEFAQKLGCKITLLRTGGHLSTSNLMRPSFWKKVSNFIKK